MSATDTDALVQTVREALARLAPMEELPALIAALDSLAHELKRLKVGRDDMAEAYRELEAELRTMQGTLEIAADQVNETEAELERVKAERDEARATALITATAETQKMYREQEARAIQAEARLDKALAALREIKQIGDDTRGWAGREAGKVARAAIAEIEGEA